MLRMKVVVHEGGGTNGNVFRQHGIERPHPVGCRPFQSRTKTGDLSERMDAGVGAACADHGDRGLTHLLYGLFDGRLDRGLVRLALPTGIAGSVVFKDELYGRHGGRSERGAEIIVRTALQR